MKTAVGKRPNNELVEVEDALGIPSGASRPFVNPLQLAVSYEFDRPLVHGNDCHARAIDRCVKSKVSFTSERNTVGRLAVKLLNITCPACGSDVPVQRGGGASCGPISGNAVGGTCECGVNVTITLTDEAIAVRFPEAKK